MKKKVLLLAVSCKKGGLCPGGLDMDDPHKWIRIVRDDGNAGAVQGIDIDFAEPLDVIEFDGNSWQLVDPTFASNNESSDVADYVGDGTNYLLKYSY